ncbi:MAG: sugar transferase [Bacteroidales bacterium]|nr:sugar transferase [Bacteroidales bacterium]
MEKLLVENPALDRAALDVESFVLPYDAAPITDALKRVFDVVCSLIGIVAFSPLILVIYVAIRIEDGGDGIFKQERIGYRGRRFMLYKFRTMVPHAEASGRPILCSKEDNRLTRVGAFLRHHHLDEFPQLWNVLKGEMSFVGYRPERKYFIDQIVKADPRYVRLYQLKPGLFSMATLYNGYTDTMEKMLIRLEMDLDYLEHRSLLLDMKIISLTAISIFSGKQF